MGPNYDITISGAVVIVLILVVVLAVAYAIWAGGAGRRKGSFTPPGGAQTCSKPCTYKAGKGCCDWGSTGMGPICWKSCPKSKCCDAA